MQRDESIDALKGIGILSVIYIHMNIETLFSQYIDSFHLMLFFFCGGYCYIQNSFEKDKKKYFIKKFKRIMYPYFVWSLLNIILNLGEQIHSNCVQIGTLINNFFLSFLHFGAIWFLPAYFICVIVSATIIDKFSNNLTRILVGCWIISYVMFAISYGVSNYFRWTQGLFSVGAFIIGFVVREEKWIERMNNISKVIVGSGLILLGVILSYTNGKSMLSQMSFGKNVVLFYVSSMISCIGYLSILKVICSIVPIKRILCYFGRNSLYILITHMYVLYIVGKIYEWTSVLGIICVFVIVSLMEAASCVLFKSSKFKWLFEV